MGGDQVFATCVIYHFEPQGDGMGQAGRRFEHNRDCAQFCTRFDSIHRGVEHSGGGAGSGKRDAVCAGPVLERVAPGLQGTEFYGATGPKARTRPAQIAIDTEAATAGHLRESEQLFYVR